MIDKLWKYITRTWNDVDQKGIHPRVKFLPPIFWDLLAAAIIIGLLVQAIDYILTIV